MTSKWIKAGERQTKKMPIDGSMGIFMNVLLHGFYCQSETLFRHEVVNTGLSTGHILLRGS